MAMTVTLLAIMCARSQGSHCSIPRSIPGLVATRRLLRWRVCGGGVQLRQSKAALSLHIDSSWQAWAAAKAVKAMGRRGRRGGEGEEREGRKERQTRAWSEERERS